MHKKRQAPKLGLVRPGLGLKKLRLIKAWLKGLKKATIYFYLKVQPDPTQKKPVPDLRLEVWSRSGLFPSSSPQLTSWTKQQRP